MPSQQHVILRRIYRLAFTHAFAQEAVLWPVPRSRVQDGGQPTLRVEQEHQRISELVTGLERGQPLSAEHQKVLSQVIKLVRQDMRDEEDELLAKLQSRLSPARLRWVGMAWHAVRKIAPTRAHSIVTRRPPRNVLATVPLSVLDRLRGAAEAALQRGVRSAPAFGGLAQASRRSTGHGEDAVPSEREHSSRAARALQAQHAELQPLAALSRAQQSTLWREPWPAGTFGLVLLGTIAPELQSAAYGA